MNELLATYGYLALFVGCLLEGETILVLAGFAAFRGHLDLPLVMLTAFAGTLLSDQLYFHIGRLWGIGFLERRPTWKAASQRAIQLLRRYDWMFVLAFRFLYGLRTVSPFAIGVAGLSVWRFLGLNSIAVAVWAIALAFLGYLFGQAFELFLAEAKLYEMWIFAFIAGGGLIIWVTHLVRFRRKRNAAAGL